MRPCFGQATHWDQSHGAIRIAVIDVGTNAAKMLVADVEGAGRLRVVKDEVRMVRLGEGVDAHREFAEGALHRLRDALIAFRDEYERLGARDCIAIGTSASRDIRNPSDMIAWVKSETGLDYTIISGAKEAEWSFRGATACLPALAAATQDGAARNTVTLDIGGGSTEIVESVRGSLLRQSLNIGSVRITERYFSEQPPAPFEAARAAAWVRSELGSVRVQPPTLLIGASLTQRLLALLEYGDAGMAALPTLSAQTVRRWRTRLMGMTQSEVLALNTRHMAGRSDVFPGAVLILDEVMQRFGSEETTVSPWDLRHGIALRYAEKRGTSVVAQGL